MVEYLAYAMSPNSDAGASPLRDNPACHLLRLIASHHQYYPVTPRRSALLPEPRTSVSGLGLRCHRERSPSTAVPVINVSVGSVLSRLNIAHLPTHLDDVLTPDCRYGHLTSGGKARRRC